ncbi:MAG: SDR family oxidoreductase [Pirellulales bacterium]
MQTQPELPTKTEFSQPVALVTGGGRRVGAVIARQLAAAGYRLVIHANRSMDDARRLAEELTALGQESIALPADLCDENSIERMIGEAHDHFGRIDGLVNSAAIWVRQRLEDVTSADVRRHFETNTLATFLCCQHVGRLMVEQPTGGAIVNVGDWAIARPYLNYAAYFASKGSIPTLTRTFAVELAQRNPSVRVNAILPGPVMLPPEMPEEERELVIQSTLVRREGTPAHVADAVLFLLRNDFITGVCLPVDGGRSVFAP